MTFRNREISLLSILLCASQFDFSLGHKDASHRNSEYHKNRKQPFLRVCGRYLKTHCDERPIPNILASFVRSFISFSAKTSVIYPDRCTAFCAGKVSFTKSKYFQTSILIKKNIAVSSFSRSSQMSCLPPTSLVF